MQILFKTLVLGLLIAAPALAQETDTTAGVRPVMRDNPDGKGHPNAVTCRKPQQIRASG